MSKEIFDNSVDTDRFSMTGAYNSICADGSYIAFIQTLAKHFSPNISKYILQALIRFAFYIEPVKQPKIESTKFSVRWSPNLNGDPRQCSYEGCVEIFNKLINDLTVQLESNENVTLLKSIFNHNLVSYELNVDYIHRIIDGPIHNVDNISFFWGESSQLVYSLRQYLLNPHNHNFIQFFAETYGKIAVKSFLTDRVLTGVHKTNREKRWECHPGSVHFALRKECLAIESKLIKQICRFDGFPPELQRLLLENQIILPSTEITRCPITLDPISFDKFNREILNPCHGKSSFQVGHLHPLKSLEESEFIGHMADNISWISSEGNRIQGELSVEETRELIFRIIRNYRNAGILLE